MEGDLFRLCYILLLNAFYGVNTLALFWDGFEGLERET